MQIHGFIKTQATTASIIENLSLNNNVCNVPVAIQVRSVRAQGHVGGKGRKSTEHKIIVDIVIVYQKSIAATPRYAVQ